MSKYTDFLSTSEVEISISPDNGKRRLVTANGINTDLANKQITIPCVVHYLKQDGSRNTKQGMQPYRVGISINAQSKIDALGNVVSKPIIPLRADFSEPTANTDYALAMSTYAADLAAWELLSTRYEKFLLFTDAKENWYRAILAEIEAADLRGEFDI